MEKAESVAKVTGQEERVIEFMNLTGSIDRSEAFRIGVANLTAVISHIRRLGYNIVGNRKAHTNQYGEKTHYTVYSFGKENNDKD